MLEEFRMLWRLDLSVSGEEVTEGLSWRMFKRVGVREGLRFLEEEARAEGDLVLDMCC